MNAKVHGIGLGLRAPFAHELIARAPQEVSWLEVSPENYLHRGGRMRDELDAAAERWPVVTHGLSLCVGDTDPLDAAYLRDLARFTERVRTPWHSDHLCFGAVDGAHLHDLLPMPFTQESVRHVAGRARAVQASLGVPFALENVSYYAHPGEAEMTEGEFLSEVLAAADVGLLLDVNNVFVNARNHGFDARAMIAALPLDRVVQLHVAGHRIERGGFRIDTHGEPICDEVYALLAFTLERTGPVPVLLERDNAIPPLDELLREVRTLDAIYRRATAARAP